MRLHTTLLTTAAALALSFGPALAADEAPGASSDITVVERDAGQSPGSNVESSGSSENEGSLSAPEKNAPANAPGTTGGMSDDSSANVPGAAAEGDGKTENQGSLSAPEKDKSSMAPEGSSETDQSSANVPGADAEGDSATQNQGALAAPEKDAQEGRLDSGTKTY
jgi:hypothetical protein